MNKVKHLSFTTDFKFKATEYAEKHGNRVITYEFTKSDFNMHYWKKQKDVTNKSRKAFQEVKSQKVPEPEEEILEYVRELCNNGVSDSHEMLHFKAYEIITMQGMGLLQFKRQQWLDVLPYGEERTVT